MPRVVKEILPEGMFRVRTPEGYVKDKFDKPRLERIANTANRMIGAGLSIPMPIGHRDDAVPVELDITKSANPLENNGYWGGYFVDNSDGVAKLYGWSDLDGSEEDKESPYYIAKHKIKEVSSRFLSEYTDGKGRTWKDATLHTALVLHPVVPGQKGFEDAPIGAVSMSSLDYEDDSNQVNIMRKLKEAMKKAFNVELAEDCSPKTILRDLYIAVSQFASLKEGDGESDRVPVFPITMSSLEGEDMKLSLEQAQSIVSTKAVNPATKQPYTMKDFGFTDAQQDMSNLGEELAKKDTMLKQLASTVKAMQLQIKSFLETKTADRIKNLVDTGRIPKEVAESTLIPKVALTDMSLNSDGSFSAHPLDVMLSTFEAMPSKTKAPEHDGSYKVPNPLFNDDPGSPLTGEALKSVLDSIDAA
jgi:hypothetical protein